MLKFTVFFHINNHDIRLNYAMETQIYGRDSMNFTHYLCLTILIMLTIYMIVYNLKII